MKITIYGWSTSWPNAELTGISHVLSIALRVRLIKQIE